INRRLLVVAAMVAGSLGGPARHARAVPVPTDDSGDTGSTHTSTPTTGCMAGQISRCADDHGGVATFEDEQCVCTLYEWVPRQITNADKGDVGIVPIAGNGGGEEIVRAALSAAGQGHRHAVMFYS